MPFTSPSLGPYVELKIKKLESVIGVFVVISVAANRSLNRPQHVFFFLLFWQNSLSRFLQRHLQFYCGSFFGSATRSDGFNGIEPRVQVEHVFSSFLAEGEMHGGQDL